MQMIFASPPCAISNVPGRCINDRTRRGACKDNSKVFSPQATGYSLRNYARPCTSPYLRNGPTRYMKLRGGTCQPAPRLDGKYQGVRDSMSSPHFFGSPLFDFNIHAANYLRKPVHKLFAGNFGVIFSAGSMNQTIQLYDFS